jgi:hypothetical protein
VNLNNISRKKLLESFLTSDDLHSLDTLHPTHHHFVGKGASDSQLDLLLLSSVSRL